MEGRWEGACVVTKKAERSASLWARQFHQALSPQTQSQGKAVEDRINNWERVKLAKRLEHHAIKYVVISVSLQDQLYLHDIHPLAFCLKWILAPGKTHNQSRLSEMSHTFGTSLCTQIEENFQKKLVCIWPNPSNTSLHPSYRLKQASCALTFSKSEVINCTWASHSPRRTIGITQKKGISPSPPTQKLSLCLWYVSHMVQQAANWRRVIVREQYALGSNVQILALFQGYHNIGSARD